MDSVRRVSNESKGGDRKSLDARDPAETAHLIPKLVSAAQVYSDQREAFIRNVSDLAPKDSQDTQKWSHEAQTLFENAAKNLDFQEPLKLLQLYKKNVDSRLHSDVNRMLKTLAFYAEARVPSEQLQALLDRTETWQSGRVWGQGLTVFTTGFFLIGAYQYINALHHDALVISHHPENADIEKFIWSCVIAGFGGVFGSNIISKGGLQPHYFTSLGFDKDGKAYKDGKANDFTNTWRGAAAEYSGFWGFSAAYAAVEACFGAHPKDPVLKAGVKWASAGGATLLTCLTKQWLPRLMLPRDPLLLDASTPEKRQAIQSLLQYLHRKDTCADLGDYGRAYLKGLKANIGFPGAPEVVRAVLHACSAAVALMFSLAAKKYPGDADSLSMTSAIFLGAYWGCGSRMSRWAIDQIKQAGVADAARAQERSRGAQEKETKQTKQTKASAGDGLDLEQAHAALELAAATPSQVQEVAPTQPRARRCCDCVIV